MSFHKVVKLAFFVQIFNVSILLKWLLFSINSGQLLVLFPSHYLSAIPLDLICPLWITASTHFFSLSLFLSTHTHTHPHAPSECGWWQAVHLWSPVGVCLLWSEPSRFPFIGSCMTGFFLWHTVTSSLFNTHPYPCELQYNPDTQLLWPSALKILCVMCRKKHKVRTGLSDSFPFSGLNIWFNPVL